MTPTFWSPLVTNSSSLSLCLMLPLGCEEGGKRTIGRSDEKCCTGVLYYTWAYLLLLIPCFFAALTSLSPISRSVC